METTLCHVLKLSLKELAIRRVIVNLWNDSDVLALIGNFPFKSMTCNKSKEEFQKAFEGVVKNKLLELDIPESLKKQMINLVLPIGSEIRAWKRYHEQYITDSNGEVSLSILRKLSWTSLGMIDYQKTVEELVNNELVDLVNRYNLACLYCMEDEIRSIWGKLPEEIKCTFFKDGDFSVVKLPYIPYFWPYILKGEESKLDNLTRIPGFEDASSNQRLFYFAASQCNKAGTEYFFKKLNPLEREGSLVRTSQSLIFFKIVEVYEDCIKPYMERRSEVLCYLLSVMTPKQQIESLKKRPGNSLWSFMVWPWYDVFPDITRLIWTFITAENYDSEISSIKSHFISSDYSNPKLFQDFFLHCPDFFKEPFLNQSSHFFDMCQVLLRNDFLETIQVIFGNADADGRAKIIISLNFFYLFNYLITKNRWQHVEFCLREATLSKENRETLKKTYKEFLAQDNNLPLVAEEWERFFNLLDETATLVQNTDTVHFSVNPEITILDSDISHS